MPDFVMVLGVVAVILTVTGLTSGLVERSPISFPLMFMGFGMLLGGGGLGIFEIGIHNPILEVVSTLTLSLVLFIDAVKIQIDELGRRWLIPVLILGPGTAFIIALGSVSLTVLIGFGWVLSFAGGAVLASTDPVVLREIVRDSRIPRSVRQILKLEAGTNDIVVLPVILVLIQIGLGETSVGVEWLEFLGRLLLLGPVIGLVIGGVGAWALGFVDGKVGVRREYQALFGVGLVLASYASATTLGGDGFLGAFAAGLAVVLINQTLCDCFLEYGEITSEMAMLLAFVLFGAILSESMAVVDLVDALVLAMLVIFIIRPSVLGLVLSKARMSWEAHALVSWFGPRGLNSMLLALLVVQAGVPGAELLMTFVGIVVLVSVTLHGASAGPVTSWYGRRAARSTMVEERESTAVGLFSHREVDVPLISAEEVSRLVSIGNPPPMILDVRTRSSYDRDRAQIPRSVRVIPDQVVDWVNDLPRHRLVVTYCT